MSTASSNTILKTNDGVSEFPAGLRVLVVDDDPTCLLILEKMLRNCFYEVTKCQRAEVALSILRESKTRFDIVISDVHMPDMDGFKLLEHIGLEMDLPVIMMSADDGKDVVMKGVTHGVCDYLIKPIRIEALKNIWQHVVRKRKNELEQSGSVEEGDRNQKPSEDATCGSSENEGNWRNSKRKMDEEDEGEDRDDTSPLKKPRVVWSVNLHQQFVGAVNQLGIDKAVPKKILELMNVAGITRENVASHLQKYRLYLRRLSGVSQHQSGLNMPFMGPQEANPRPMPSLDGLDLQVLAASGQLLPQNLATLQAGFGRSTANSGTGMPLVDQRNLFGSETPNLRFGEGQQLSRGSKQVNEFHEIPTSMEPKKRAHLHQSVQTLGGMGLQVSEGVSGILNLLTPVRTTSSSAHMDSVRRIQSSSSLMQMAQPWSRGPLLNEIAGGHASGLPSTIRQQPIFSNEISGRALGINGTLLNVRGATHNPLSQASSMVDFPTNCITEFPMNASPLGSTTGISTLTLTDVFQEGGNSEIRGPIGFAPSYDIFDELRQRKPQEWQLQDVGLQGNLDLLPSALSHQGFISSEKNGQNRNTTVVGRTMVSLGEEYENQNPVNIAQRHNNFLFDNSFMVKSESMPDLSCENALFAEHFGQDDLMTALLKQQQEGGLVECEFNLDGYPMDNIPV